LGVTLKVSRTTGHVKEEFTMMGWYGGGMGGFGLLGMGLFWLILLGLIVWLVTRLLPGSRDDQPAPSTGESAVGAVRRSSLVVSLVAAVIALVASAAVAVGTFGGPSFGPSTRGYGQGHSYGGMMGGQGQGP
jgi:predicted lipid-binding transport protein (Tim44 family)